jgi:hypothetical protein
MKLRILVADDHTIEQFSAVHGLSSSCTIPPPTAFRALLRVSLNAVIYDLIHASVELFWGMLAELTAANLALSMRYGFLFGSRLSFGVKANG